MQAQPLRRYPFETIANFRDLGGYAVGQRAMTRWGVFFRSARLSEADAGELEAIKGLGIRTVIDLRMQAEIERRPDVGMDDPQLGWRHLSLIRETDMGDVDIHDAMENADLVPPMSTLYAQLLSQNSEAFCSLFEMLAERVRLGAVLFHCTAGKDRTGLTAMLLMGLCGVDRLDIISHYEVSKTYNMLFMPDDLTGSDAENMIMTLDMLDRDYGGPAEYLKKAGVTAGALETIRERLLAPR